MPSTKRDDGNLSLPLITFTDDDRGETDTDVEIKRVDPNVIAQRLKSYAGPEAPPADFDNDDDDDDDGDDDGESQRPKNLGCKIVSITISSLVVIGAATLVSIYFMEDVLNWHRGLGDAEGISLYASLYVGASFPIFFGYVILNVGAGYIYGLEIGLTITILSTLFGCTLATYMMRTCCRGMTKKGTKKKGLGRHLKLLIERGHGFKIIAMTRMTPLPLGFQNAVFAASNVNFWTLFFATFVGLVPLQLIWVYFGTTLNSLTDVVDAHNSDEDEQIIVIVVEVLITIIIIIFVRYKVKQQIAQAMEEEGLTVDQETLENATGTKHLHMPNIIMRTRSGSFAGTRSNPLTWSTPLIPKSRSQIMGFDQTSTL